MRKNSRAAIFLNPPLRSFWPRSLLLTRGCVPLTRGIRERKGQERRQGSFKCNFLKERVFFFFFFTIKEGKFMLTLKIMSNNYKIQSQFQFYSQGLLLSVSWDILPEMVKA